MILPRDAWVIRRLLCGASLNGEAKLVSEPFAAIVEELSGAEVGLRQAAWAAFLGECGDDREGIVLAVAAFGPEDPAPEPGETEGWGPIRNGWALPPGEPFPIEVLPDEMLRVVVEGARRSDAP